MNPQVAVGAARQYAENLLGGPLTEIESNPTALITLTVLTDGNGDRVGLIIVNQGANPLYIGVNPAISATNAILLVAAGGFIAMDCTRDFTLPSRRWYCITTGGSSAVYVLQLVRVSLPTAQG